MNLNSMTQKETLSGNESSPYSSQKLSKRNLYKGYVKKTDKLRKQTTKPHEIDHSLRNHVLSVNLNLNEYQAPLRTKGTLSGYRGSLSPEKNKQNQIVTNASYENNLDIANK